MARPEELCSEFVSTRICSPDFMPRVASRRWKVLRTVVLAVARFKHLQAYVVQDVEKLLVEVEQSPHSRRRACKSVTSQAIDQHRCTANFFLLISRGCTEDLATLTALITADPRRYLHDLSDRNSIVNCKNVVGHTPLYEAALNGHLAVVKLLLDNSADAHLASKVSETEEETPLEVAVRWNHLHVVEFLLQVDHFTKQELAKALKVCRSDVLRRRLKTFKVGSGGLCCGRSK